MKTTQSPIPQQGIITFTEKMSLNRYRCNVADPDQTVSLHPRPLKYRPDLPYCLSKHLRPRSKHITHSLHSLDVRPDSLHIPSRKRGQVRSHTQSETRVAVTERRRKGEQEKREGVMSGRICPRERIYTIDDAELNEKEQRLKESLEVMRGALSEIQNQKSQRRRLRVKKEGILRSRVADQEISGELQTHKVSKFESYVKSLCKNRQESKVVLIRKAKNKSVLSHSSSQNCSLPKPASRLNDLRPKEIPPISDLPRNKKPIFQEIQCSVDSKEEFKLEQIECSVIAKVSQGSFMSDVGKASLFRHLDEDKQKDPPDGNKMLTRLKNHRKLKNLFPDGFF